LILIVYSFRFPGFGLGVAYFWMGVLVVGAACFVVEDLELVQETEGRGIASLTETSDINAIFASDTNKCIA
jgi:hypothetical protein